MRAELTRISARFPTSRPKRAAPVLAAASLRKSLLCVGSFGLSGRACPHVQEAFWLYNPYAPSSPRQVESQAAHRATGREAGPIYILPLPVIQYPLPNVAYIGIKASPVDQSRSRSPQHVAQPPRGSTAIGQRDFNNCLVGLSR